MVMAMHMKPPAVAIVLLVFALLMSGGVESESESESGVGEWSLVTKLNFSSQTRLHPHILLVVTVPWCGESRSLMRDVSTVVSSRPQEFHSFKLKLMYMFKNSDRILADAIGASANGISVFYYRHSVAFKYRGMLRPQSILFSIRSHIAEELPLTLLSDPLGLKAFLDSTDRALLLFDFCGWTSNPMSNVAEDGLSAQDFMDWTSRRLAPMGMSMQKDIENSKMTCDIDNEVNKVPWLVDFSSIYGSAPSGESGDRIPSILSSSCTLDEYQKFESFFTKFVVVAKDFFLPSERHRYGLVSERSMLSTFGIGDSDSWLAVLHVAGCPSCLKIIKKEDDLNDVLQMGNSVISELEVHGHALELVLPGSRPSALLFIDRSSDSEEIRSKSKKALDYFRELAWEIHNSYLVDGQSRKQHEKSFRNQVLRSTYGPPRLKFSSAAQVIMVNEKMSTAMIVNEGKQVMLDNKISSGSSLNEILAYVLQQKKDTKLSSMAKELGFQLLSDDLDIKLVNRLPLEADPQSHSVSPEAAKEDLASNGVNQNHDQLYSDRLLKEVIPVTSKVTGAEIIEDEHNEKKSKEVYESSHLSTGSGYGDDKDEEPSSLQGDEFKPSFSFSDGNFRSLRGLTGGSKVPCLIIVDPALEQHYVFPEESDLDYTSMSDFLSRFLNGSLIPYRKSEFVTQSPREVIQPPFVNMDFHEVDSIPHITNDIFSELVVGVNQSDSDAWHDDVLVLFSNRWCGFCQRMELVVREVYRAMKGYITTASKSIKDIKMKVPSIYLLDCTLNDCSLILRSINQTESYPSLMLFPGEKKYALPYDGHMGVTDVIKFIASHGPNSRHLIHETGILLNSQAIALSTDNPDEPVTEKQRCHKVVLGNLAPKKSVELNRIESQTSVSLGRRAKVTVGSILIATDKLQNVELFGKSEILIVRADESSGFQGLIINKLIRWDALNELEQGLQIVADAPLSLGGPLMQHGAILVSLTRNPMQEDAYAQVLPNVYFLDQSATYDKLSEFKSGNQSVTDYWFFVGYSSWGWDQLYDEIADDAWSISDDSLYHFVWP